MSLYKKYGTNVNLEVDGVWFEFEANSDGTIPGFLVSRATARNKVYQKVSEQVLKNHKNKIKRGTIENKIVRDLDIEIFVKGLLRNWKNIQNINGENIPFSIDSAISLFSDLPDLFDKLIEDALTMENYQNQELEIDSKN